MCPPSLSPARYYHTPPLPHTVPVSLCLPPALWRVYLGPTLFPAGPYLCPHLPRSTPLREAYSLHVQGIMWGLGCRGESHSAVRSLVFAEASALPLPHSIFLHAFRYASSLSRLPPTRYAQAAWEWHLHEHLTTGRSPWLSPLLSVCSTLSLPGQPASIDDVLATSASQVRTALRLSLLTPLSPSVSPLSSSLTPRPPPPALSPPAAVATPAALRFYVSQVPRSSGLPLYLSLPLPLAYSRIAPPPHCLPAVPALPPTPRSQVPSVPSQRLLGPCSAFCA